MGLFDSIFGGGGSSQQTTNEPWEKQQEFLRRGYRGAEAGVFDRPLHYYPGQTVAPFSQPTRYGLGGMMGRAQGGNPLNPMSQQQAYDTMAGDYFAQGPGYEAMLDSVASSVIPQVESSFATGGRSGSALANEAVGRGVSRGISPFLDAERNRMIQAASMAPGLANQDYYDIDRMLGAGQMYDQKNQQRLSDDVARWDFYQNEPYQRMQRYQSLIGGALPGNQSTSGSSSVNPFTMLAGLGTGATGAAGTLGWQPFA